MYDYIVLRSNQGFTELAVQVNVKLSEGYVCQGGIADNQYYCSQAMVKLLEPETNELRFILEAIEEVRKAIQR
jgi:hypothetical protein